MKSGENKLRELISLMIQQNSDDQNGPYKATVLDTAPLTIQPLDMTIDGKKKVPIRGVGQLDMGSSHSLKVGDTVLVIVTANDYSSKDGKAHISDENRQYSIDSSIVLGVVK